MSDLVRDIYWAPWDDPGLEHLHLTIASDGGESRFRYDAVGDDFTAELPVDADGLVMDYPDLFKRVWPT